MAKPKRLNDASSEVIENNILKENPEGFEKAEVSSVAIMNEIPKMETIIFRNDRDPGIPLEFHYHSKTHPLHHYKLFPGEQYTLPVEIVEHLENCAVPLYSYRKGPDGHPQMYVAGYKNNFTCKVVRQAA